MASVLIRNVDATLHARLKASAAAHRRSLEEEARALLRAAIARQEPPRESLVALARRLFGPEHGADLALPPRGAAPASAPPDFSGPDVDPAAR